MNERSGDVPLRRQDVRYLLLHWRRLVLLILRRWSTSWVDQPRALKHFLEKAGVLPGDWNIVEHFVKLAPQHLLFVNHVDIHYKDIFLTKFCPRKRPDLALPRSLIVDYVLPFLGWKKANHRVLCWKCGEGFESRNKLFQHMRAGCYLEPCLRLCSSCYQFKRMLDESSGQRFPEGRPAGFVLM